MLGSSLRDLKLHGSPASKGKRLHRGRAKIHGNGSGNQSDLNLMRTNY